MAWGFIVFGALIAWILWTVFSLGCNLQNARRTGLPVVISPVNPYDPLWRFVSKSLPINRILKRLPSGLGLFARCSYVGWQFDEKHVLHGEIGDAFLLVSPISNLLVVADPDAFIKILAHRKEFPRPNLIFSMLSAFLHHDYPSLSFLRANGKFWSKYHHGRVLAFSHASLKIFG